MREVLVNEQALIQAANFVVGEQATNAIINLYQMIGTTQKHAYDQGVLQGQEDVEQATADAWDAGYDTGEADGMDMADDAYIQGVADARARPETADERVAYLSEKSLLDAAEDDAFDNGFEEGAEQGRTEGYDSGYLDGVADARARPSLADVNVQKIIGEQEVSEYQLDLFDEEYPVGCGGPTATSAGTRTAARTDEP